MLTASRFKREEKIATAWKDLTALVVQARSAGKKSCAEIAAETGCNVDQIIGIWAGYCRTQRMLNQKVAPPPTPTSIAELLAEWKRNVRAVIDGEML